jgi:hypothetical protein
MKEENNELSNIKTKSDSFITNDDIINKNSWIISYNGINEEDYVKLLDKFGRNNIEYKAFEIKYEDLKQLFKNGDKDKIYLVRGSGDKAYLENREGIGYGIKFAVFNIFDKKAFIDVINNAVKIAKLKSKEVSDPNSIKDIGFRFYYSPKEVGGILFFESGVILDENDELVEVGVNGAIR